VIVARGELELMVNKIWEGLVKTKEKFSISSFGAIFFNTTFELFGCF